MKALQTGYEMTFPFPVGGVTAESGGLIPFRHAFPVGP
jgi:hypothetical protein